MKMVQVLPLALLALSSASAVTPIQKVLEMMDGMLQNAEKDKHDETTRFSAFSQWCESTKAEKERTIKDQSDQIGQLEADITKSEADSDKLGQEISGLGKDVDGWSAEVAKSKSTRKAENAEYQATHLDYSESVDALERAIHTLKQREKDVPQSLVQVRKVIELKRLPGQVKHALDAFLQSSTSAEAGAPEANAYEFQSTSVVDMLEKLRLRFQDERLALEKEEMNKKAAFDMMLQSLTDDIEYAKKQTSEKSQARAQAQEDAATAKGDLAQTTAARTADKTYLSDTMAECDSKSKDYEGRQITRAGEIEAIKKAIEIISSPEVSGAGATHLPAAAFVQRKRPTALSQLRKSSTPDSDKKAKLVSMLLQASRESKSDLLAMVAGRVGEDPFAKVKKMIKDLIVKLSEAANQEADHKGFCDAELATNKATRDAKTSESNELTAQIDELTSKNAKLKQDISDLGDELSELAANVKSATEARIKEKAANTATIADAKAASSAVTQAMKVLKEFYAKAAAGASLVQAGQKPEFASGAYAGQQSESGGVMGMLEVIQSDFARLEAETSNGEDSAQREHDQFIADSSQSKEMKEKESRHKGFDQVRTERALKQAQKDLKSTQAELDAALDYYDKLKPQCVDNGLSYEDRVAQREAEIKSLQEALKVLDGTDI
jgi:predicted  nucleic acid-binding Zn-ribbon protein